MGATIIYQLTRRITILYIIWFTRLSQEIFVVLWCLWGGPPNYPDLRLWPVHMMTRYVY